MIPRRAAELVRARLRQFPAVALLGPRQVGKTTLAAHLAGEVAGAGAAGIPGESVYLDLEDEADRAKLADAAAYLAAHENSLVVLDEVQRVPDLFATLRGVIDRGRRRGLRAGRFLLLGPASNDLLRQSGESLAGRIAHVELAPFSVLEVDASRHGDLWIRGGFPDSFLANDGNESTFWRESFVRTYLERDIPQLGPRIPATILRRFWTMLAHVQGGVHNAAALARGLDVDGKTVARYLDLLVDLLLVRRLPPYHANVRKRLVKSPKVYLRDSGIVHALLRLESRDDVLGHPVAGPSWEGFVVENLLGSLTSRAGAFFYRTASGAEVDLVLEMPGGELWAVEIKRSRAPKLARGFHHAREDLKPSRSFVVHAGEGSFPLARGVEAIGVAELAATLAGI